MRRASLTEAGVIQSRFGIIGRETELRKALAAVKAGKHVLIEGPVGVGKTVIAEAVARYLGKSIHRVDGDERYTEQKLTGWFDPPLVIRNGYSKDAFIGGPLALAMDAGGVLFINELNRMPEGVQNVLLPAMDERKIETPKIGTLIAKRGFIVIATQNPHEFIATSALSEALRDRFELLTLDYQDEKEEVAIVQKHTGVTDLSLISPVVRIVRATRAHPEIRRGASLRAAMSTCLLACQLGSDIESSIREAAHMALPTRMELKDDAARSIHEIIDELLEKHLSDKTASEGSGVRVCTVTETPTTMSRTLATDRPAIDNAINLLESLSEAVPLNNTQSDDVGWSIAKYYTDIKTLLKDRKLVELAKRIAIRAIVYRTLQLLGATKRREDEIKEQYVPGLGGEIDVEMTVEQMLGKTLPDASDIIVESKTPRRMACIMMIDTSLSMSGPKVAMAMASLGVLAYKLKTIQYSIITFDSAARVLKPLDRKVSVETIVSELLDIPAMGFTNIEDGLRKGIVEMNRTIAKEKIAILITDGNYTAGKDPRKLAAEYPRLFVIMMKSDDSQPKLCADMAALGKGKVMAVDGIDEIPAVLKDLLRDLYLRRPSSFQEAHDKELYASLPTKPEAS
jgi:MoxR-like ATPase